MLLPRRVPSYRFRTSSVSSTDSTIPVDGADKLVETMEGKHQKKVRFVDSSMTNQVMYTLTNEDEEDRHWYSSQECNEMKQSFYQSIDQMRRSQTLEDGMFREALDRVFQEVQEEHETHADALSSLLEEERTGCTHAPGLELRVCKAAYAQRNVWRRKQLECLLMYNLRKKHQQPEQANDRLLVEQHQQEEPDRRLAMQCAAISRPARMFAQMIAQLQYSWTWCELVSHDHVQL